MSAKEPAAYLLLDSATLARRLCVGVRTVWRMVRRGELPQPVRLNRKLVRWPAPLIDAWLMDLVQRQQDEQARQAEEKSAVAGRIEAVRLFRR